MSVAERTVPEPFDGARVVLESDRLTKKFGDIVAVRELSVGVREGEVFGLLGPNGAGKSTTINMICGLLKPDAGDIRLYGEMIRPGSAVVKKRVGVCPQDIVIWPKLTCLEQLVFMGTMYDMARPKAKERGLVLLADLGLAEKRNKRAATLSGGMKRRLNLALALVHDPDVVILDEPEAGLDPQSRVLVREYIRAMAKRKTVLFTTHNMDEAERVCDRVAIIDRGSLLTVDTPDHLKKTAGGGSVLEVQVDGRGDAAAAAADIVRSGFQAVATGPAIVVRAADIVTAIPAVMDCLKKHGVTAVEVKLRENTLEDVFIALTGRRLRE